MTQKLLSIRDLRVYYYLRGGVVKAVDRVSIDIKRGEIFGLVGESGCGKSTIALSILSLVPFPGKIVGGEILFEGKDVLKMNPDELRKIRGNRLALVPQDPTSSLNPVFTVGSQIAEAILSHRKLNKPEVESELLSILNKVAMPDARRRILAYPHEFSGGMRQRAMIAMALVNDPQLLICDEPTTNLDVTIEAQILDLIEALVKTSKRNSALFITHNLGIIAQLSERLGVMYAGKIIEYGRTSDIFNDPKHPYTLMLLKSVSRPDKDLNRLEVIPGSVPSLIDPPSGCKFHPRCEYTKDICRKQEPELAEVEPGLFVACHLR